MSKDGFINIVLDNTNKIYRIGLSTFDWYKKILGTKCEIKRLKESDSYRDVFGSIASSTIVDDPDAEVIPYVILINMNDMKKLYNKTSDQLQFYDNKSVIKLGDLLIFSRLNQEYTWQVTQVDTFSETENVLQQYTISGLNEIDSLNK